MAAKGSKGRGYTPVGRMEDSDRRGASAQKQGVAAGRGRGTGAQAAQRERELEEEDLLAVIQPFLDKLDSWDPYDKRSALSNLAAEGPRIVQHAPLIAANLTYKDDEPEADAEVRKAAAYALGKVGPICGKGIAKQLANSIEGETDANARAEKARALGLLGTEAAASFASKLVPLASDPDEGVGLAAVGALSALGEVDLIGPFINNPVGQTRRTAINEVARSPEARVKHKALIAGRISDKETVVRLAAVQATGDIGDAAGAEHLALLGALHKGEKQVKVRKMAVHSLGRIGPAAVPALVDLFKDPNHEVRHEAGTTLGGIVGGPEAAAGAAEQLDVRSPEVRRAALLALGRCEKAGLRHCRKVSEHFHDDDLECRLAAIQAISDMKAGSQAESLSALAGDENKGVRQASVHALAKLGEDGAAEAWKFIEDAEQAVRCCAIRVYSPLHSKLSFGFARPFAGVVATRLDDEDWRVRFEAAKALGDLHATEFAEQVGALAKDPDGQTRRTAVSALAKMDEDAWPMLLPFLEDEDPKVSKEARLEVDAMGGKDILLSIKAEQEAAKADQTAQPPAAAVADDDDDEVISDEDKAPARPAAVAVADEDDDEVISDDGNAPAKPAAVLAAGGDDDEVIDAEEEELSEPD